MQQAIIKHFTEKSVKIFNQHKITIYHSRIHKVIIESKYPKISWMTKKEKRKQRDSWSI